MKSISPRSSHRSAGMLALLLGLGQACASPESDAVLENFGELEWIGGRNGEVLDNSSEWKPEYEGQPATAADLSEPHSAAGDLLGNIYIADKNAHAIRVIDRSGRIRTVAGTNTAGYNGEGPARQRQLNGPQNAYPMPDGSFYILDTGNQRIRRVDAAGQMSTVIVENTGLSRGLWVKRDGSLIYYCTNTALKRWTPAFGSNPGAVMASGFSELGNIDVAANGDIYLTDRGNLTTDPTSSKVFRIAPNATPSTFTPQVVAGTGGTTDSGPGASGSLATQVGIRGVRGIAFHPAGGYFLATHKGGDLWYVDRNGIMALAVQGNDANANVPATLPRALPALGSAVVSELRSVSVALNGDLLMATNDSGYILRARYQGPVPGAAELRMIPPTAAGRPVSLEWTPAPGRWSRVESTSDPATEIWTPRTVAPAGVSGYPYLWTEPFSTTSQPRQYYRLREFRDWPN